MPEQPQQPHPPPRLGSLCTGYGGLDLAVEDVFGARLEWVADPARGPAAVLAHQYPDVPNLGDLNAIRWEELPPVDIVTAGFPCQPVSLAGRRRGTSDDRWLFHDILDGVRRLPRRPELLVFENVRGLLRASEGEAMQAVIHGLARDGFLARWRILRASDVGAPHQRPRVFIVARDTLCDRRRMGSRRDRTASPRTPSQTLSPSPDDHRPGGTRRLDTSAWGRFAPAIRRWEHVTGRPAPFPAEIGPRGYPRVSSRFLEWVMGLPDGWVTDVPGLSATAQRHLLGNGVMPQQAISAVVDLMNWPDP